MSSITRGGQQRAAPESLAQHIRFPWVGNSKTMRLVRKRLEWASQSLHPILIKGSEGTGHEWAACWLHEQSGFQPTNLSWVDQDQGRDLLWMDSFPTPGSLILKDFQDWTEDARDECYHVLSQLQQRQVPLRVMILCVTQDKKVSFDLGREQFLQKMESTLKQIIPLYPVELPNVRDCVDDWVEVLELFGLQSWCSADGLKAMRHYSWPKNWDELEDLADLNHKGCNMERAWEKISLPEIQDGTDNALNLSDQLCEVLSTFFMAHRDREPSPGLYHRLLREMERPLLEQTMRYCRGNQVKASRILGLNRNTLYQKLKQHGLQKLR